MIGAHTPAPAESPPVPEYFRYRSGLQYWRHIDELGKHKGIDVLILKWNWILQNHLSFMLHHYPTESGILFKYLWLHRIDSFFSEISLSNPVSSQRLPMAPDTNGILGDPIRNCKILHSLRPYIFLPSFCTAILLLTDNHHRSVSQTIFGKLQITVLSSENSFLRRYIPPDSAAAFQRSIFETTEDDRLCLAASNINAGCARS